MLTNDYGYEISKIGEIRTSVAVGFVQISEGLGVSLRSGTVRSLVVLVELFVIYGALLLIRCLGSLDVSEIV